MNCSRIRVKHLCIVNCTLLLACLVSNTLQAQTDEVYDVFWLNSVLPPQTESVAVNELKVDATNNMAIVVGHYKRSDRTGRQAFVYDHLGYIDSAQPQKFWDIQELVGPNPPSWATPNSTESRFSDVNSSGRICGYVKDSTTGNISGIYFDLGGSHHELQELPSTNSNFNDFYGLRVNELGDVLIVGLDPSGSPIGNAEITIFNPDSTDKIDLPFDIYYRGEGLASAYFNSMRQVVGLAHGSNVNPGAGTFYGELFFHSAFDIDGDGVSDGPTDVSNEFSQVSGINESSEFSCIWTDVIPKKGRNQFRYEEHAAKVGADGEIIWESANGTYNTVGEINNAGDLIYSVWDSSLNDQWYLFDEGDPNVGGDEQPFIRLLDLVANQAIGNDDTAVYFDELSNRDQSGLGWIAGRVDLDGDGSKDQLFLLIPKQPSAGFTVSPASGLVTAESGGTANFDVVLNTEPTADVTIGISSSNTGEGLLEVPDPNDPGGTLLVESYDLFFDATNWDQPQTVTVVGQGDEVADGNDVTYTIITDPAVSDDLDYKELDAEDVQVTNLDPSSGGSETYSSNDTPTNIRDRKNTFSTISIGDDYGIAGMTVNLDISHNRPSDLSATLIGPDGTETPLLNFSGNNDVIAFNDTSSLGDWTLKVRDNNRGETGTLNGWSITVDY